MQSRELFRSEAVAHQTNKIYGTVFINIPIQYSIIGYGLILLLTGFIFFSLAMDYTEQYVVKGYLNPESGIVHVYPLRAGIISKQIAMPGQLVKQGDVLYVIDSSYDNFAKYPSPEYRQLQARLRVLEHDIQDKARQLRTIEPLLKKHYISLSAYQMIREEAKALEARRHDMLMAFIRYKRAQTYCIRAPIAGEISTVASEAGQVVNPLKPLLTIIPSATKLIAQLYIPVSKSGFISQGTPIALRYDAYPYQHFGIATGHIVSMAHSVLSDRNEDKPLTIGEPYYKAIAVLDKQTIKLYGHQHPLQQGMTCSVLVYGMHKKIWQWIVDPLRNTISAS